MNARSLVRLYPSAWRERYGAEIEDLLGTQPLSLQVTVDLLLGALDAHVHPELGPAAATPQGVLWMLNCRPTRAMWWTTAGLLLVMVAVAMLRRAVGFNLLLDFVYFGLIGLIPMAISTVGWRRDPRRLRIVLGGVVCTGLVGTLLTNGLL